MRKIIALLILLPGVVLAYASPGKPAGFVNDYAGMLSASDRESLELVLQTFDRESTNEIVVATIATLGGDTIENFAVQLFKDWGIGKKKKDNGVLLLVARDDRAVRIEVGYGLEGALTDAQSSQIINSIIAPAFQKGDYYAGILGAVNAIVSATKGEYAPAPKPLVFGNISYFLYSIFFVFIWLSSIFARSKSWWLGGVVGGVFALIIFFLIGAWLWFFVLIPFGLWFDFLVSRGYEKGKVHGRVPWWAGGMWGGGPRGGGGGFGGFGGGGSGGGGSSGKW